MFSKFKKLKKHHQLTASLIVTIAVVGIWRGCWRIFDHYVFPEYFLLSSLIPLILGIAILAATHNKLT